MAQIAARVTAPTNALSLSEATRLELTCAERCVGAVRCEMTAPDRDCLLTFKGSSFHSELALPKSFLQSRSASFIPCSVRTTDLALLTGSET